jgi:glutamate N-acetyltransferase / amino-acid N-acetyltransferase
MSELHLLSPKGFAASGVYCGIKSRPVPDLGLLICDGPASAAAVFTTNKVVSPAVTIGKRHIAGGYLRGVVVNSGNANACTGKQGLTDAIRMCELAAAQIGAKTAQFLPSSTGIIGHLLPMEKLENGIPAAAAKLGDSAEHAALFADSILTTDLCRKVAGAQFKIRSRTVHLAGVCKGSGMIGPRLALPTSGGRHATMLAYLTTDAKINPAILRKALFAAADDSFNAVTVDDHSSTNDTACLLASGLGGGKVDSPGAVRSFAAALKEVCQSLAWQIAADGEGATKVVKIHVSKAVSIPAAKAMARAIAVSPLVKCAMHGNDPNWGRIVSAAGLAGVPFDADKCVLTLAGTVVFRAGRPALFDAEAVSAALKAREVSVELNCRVGSGSATIWTCDLSKEYVTINADYHT